MKRWSYLNLKLFEKYQKELIALGNMTEEDIRDVFIEKDDEYVEDLSTLEYNYMIPLYQKMIFRLRACKHRSPAFFRQIDPICQSKVLRKYEMRDKIHSELVEFFAWMCNTLGPVDIICLEFEDVQGNCEIYINKSKYMPYWRKNPLLFFFEILSDNEKQRLIKRYNKECVKSINEIYGYDDVEMFDNEGIKEFPVEYGVCDSPEQFAKRYPDYKGYVWFLVIKRSEQPNQYGWRWHKWGEYIGEYNIKNIEYLYQAKGTKGRPLIDEQWCFWMEENEEGECVELPNMLSSDLIRYKIFDGTVTRMKQKKESYITLLMK